MVEIQIHEVSLVASKSYSSIHVFLFRTKIWSRNFVLCEMYKELFTWTHYIQKIDEWSKQAEAFSFST